MPLGPITVNDAKGKVGSPVTVDANMHFVGDGLTFVIVSVMHPMNSECIEGGTNAATCDATSDTGDIAANTVVRPTIKSISETPAGSGMFVITLSRTAQFHASTVTLRATDENGLWLDQDFDVMRNRVPKVHADTATAGKTVSLGTAERTSMLFPISDVFDDDDDFEVVELFNSKPAAGTLTIDNLVGNLIANAVGAGQTTVDLSATDSGGLVVQNKVHINVYPGPALKAAAPPAVVLDLAGEGDDDREDDVLLTNFYTAATMGADGAADGDGSPSAVVYGTLTSSNPAVASIRTATVSDNLLTVTLHSVGSTTITVPVMQETGPGTANADGRFDQTITIKFTLTVR
jgi:hypothetical protein